MNTSLATEFETYLNETQLGRLPIRNPIDAVQTMLAFKIITESRKRRISKGCDGLLRDAAIATVAENVDGFAGHAHRAGFGFSSHEQLIEHTADEIAVITPVLKAKVGGWLHSYRAELFEESEYTQHLDSASVSQHPMETFTDAINRLDAAKSKSLTKGERNLYVNLANLLRSGNAVLKLHEWTATGIGPDGKIIG